MFILSDITHNIWKSDSLKFCKNVILNSFLASGYKETLIVIFVYNEFLNEHLNDISRTDAWGKNAELAMLCLLTGVDNHSICATTYNLDNGRAGLYTAE